MSRVTGVTRRAALAALATATAGWFLMATGCERSLDEPADPVWGKEPCAHCAMLVSERPHAAQATLSDGRRLYFDDIGCMVAAIEREPSRARGAWARAGDGGWVDARRARYQRGAKTPMDFGFSARQPGDEGLSYDEMKGEVLTRLAQERTTP